VNKTGNIQTNVRLSDDERRMLAELAKAHHLSQASMLRLLIVAAHNRLVTTNGKVEVPA
jgi:hypothetical protein